MGSCIKKKRNRVDEVNYGNLHWKLLKEYKYFSKPLNITREGKSFPFSLMMVTVEPMILLIRHRSGNLFPYCNLTSLILQLNCWVWDLQFRLGSESSSGYFFKHKIKKNDCIYLANKDRTKYLILLKKNNFCYTHVQIPCINPKKGNMFTWGKFTARYHLKIKDMCIACVNTQLHGQQCFLYFHADMDN